MDDRNSNDEDEIVVMVKASSTTKTASFVPNRLKNVCGCAVM